MKLLPLVLVLTLSDAMNITVSKSKRPWKLKEALKSMYQFVNFNATWFNDEEFYYTASDKSIRKYNAAANTTSVFLDASFLNSYSGAMFTLSPDNSKILVRYNLTEKFRHSYVAQYDVYDIATKKSIKMHKGEKLQYCGWSPLQDRLAYVYLNNVYVHFSEEKEVQITDDGVDGIVYNGVPDWVYEEEVLSSGHALWWSPDGNKLAVGFFNDTKVETFRYTLYGDTSDNYAQYPHEEQLKYPKPGTPNPVVNVRVYDLSSTVPVMKLIGAPVNIVGDDHILEHVVWTDSSHLLITWLNRRQNLATMQRCTQSGECTEIKRLDEPHGWINIDTPKCLSNGINCIFTYWIDDWLQVWNLNLLTGENIWKRRGRFTVLNIYGYDEVNDRLYYQATQLGSPDVYHVYRNDICLSCHMEDADGTECLSASASFSKGYSYYSISCTGPNPVYTRIFKMTPTSMEQINDWEPNAAYRAKLATKLRPSYSFINVKLKDGSFGICKLALPPGFDDKKKYPMIVVVYGGPNSVRVTNSFTVGFEAFVTTNRDTIYAYIDGRGTGNKGKDLLFSVNNDLGDHEVEDQLHVTKWLQIFLGFVDPERTAIWGWSYGGYMTAKTIEADDKRVFQCGVAVAPVTSWLYYDTIYTERYMGLPDSNAQKYNESDTYKNLENFRTHDFLLVHGSGDDNVHYQHSLLLAKRLQRADIQFEEQTYTDENHGIGNALPHLYHTIDRFFANCLNLDTNEA
ncbi:CG11034 [Drosophila busckii]|uniref:Venom dipeptidyl peptidase 4 n=2 Tax=Drosophila busckii TaxID=30019 RepID=A0A0M4EGC5_DROBS|nr:CG11034 [Drosophila busckii]